MTCETSGHGTPTDHPMGPSLADLTHILDRSLDATRQLTRRPRAALRAWTKTTGPNRHEPVSSLDIAVENTLVQALTRAFPGAAIYAEESSHDPDALQAPLCFVIDPIDGTRELLAGRDGYATMIATLDDGTPILGVTDFPARDWRFHATPDSLTLNHEPLPPAPEPNRPGKLTIAVSPDQQRAGTLSRLHANPRLALTPHGAVANKLAKVALGTVDAALHAPGQRITLWDYLALAIGLESIGRAMCRPHDDADLAKLRPTVWDGGWIAGPPETRAILRAALYE